MLATAKAIIWEAGGVIGPRVSGHAAAADALGNVFVFGGLSGSAGSPTTDALWVYKDKRWDKLDPSGKGPGPCMYSAAAVLDSSFFVFGGWDPEAPGSGGTFKEEVWSLDINKMKWMKMEPLPCGAISRHTACTVGGRIIVHSFRGVVVYESGSMLEQATTGDVPVGLSMCAAVPLGDHEMLLVMGSTKNQAMSADSYVLDTRTWEWRRLRPTGDALPSPRASVCAAAIDCTTCVVFGGAGLGGGGYEGGAGLVAFDETWKLRVEGNEAIWERLQSDVVPAARVAASLVALGNERLLLQGGWDPASKITYDRHYVLTL